MFVVRISVSRNGLLPLERFVEDRRHQGVDFVDIPLLEFEMLI